MNFSWLSQDFLMTFLWLSHDFLMNLSLLSYDFLITFLGLSHKLLMAFLLFSHDFLIIYLFIKYYLLLHLAAVVNNVDSSVKGAPPLRVLVQPFKMTSLSLSCWCSWNCYFCFLNLLDCRSFFPLCCMFFLCICNLFFFSHSCNFFLTHGCIGEDRHSYFTCHILPGTKIRMFFCVYSDIFCSCI